jgi:hypothetical protein
VAKDDAGFLTDEGGPDHAVRGKLLPVRLAGDIGRMKPALTPEEWKEWRRGRVSDRIEGRTFFVASDCGGEPYAEEVELDAHETAAKCLYGQPFGFTREDVLRLRAHAKWYDEQTQGVVYACPIEDIPSWQLRDMAERIAALLPPEEPDA